MFHRRAQLGLSLIETLCTLTIMGTVAASAMPRLAHLPTEARVSVIQGLEGAVRAASNLVHAQCAVQPTCPHRSGEGVVHLSAQPVQLRRGYPAAGHEGGIAATLQLSGFAVQHVGEDTVFVRADAPRVEACAVRYSAPDADGGVPRIAVRTDGC